MPSPCGDIVTTGLAAETQDQIWLQCATHGFTTESQLQEVLKQIDAEEPLYALNQQVAYDVEDYRNDPYFLCMAEWNLTHGSSLIGGLADIVAGFALIGPGLFEDVGVYSGSPDELTTTDVLSQLATKAASQVGPGEGPVYGTLVHSAFATEVGALGDAELSTEVSYLNGTVVPYATPGSVRLDVVEGDLLAPTAIYDLKTGSATLTAARIAQIRSNLPPGYQSIPVLEIRP
jgi:hypothetical protein